MSGSSGVTARRRGGRTAVALAVALGLVVAMVPGTAFGGWWRYIEPEVVSASPLGEPGNEDSYHPSITDDGRYVAFDSHASNLGVDNANVNNDGDRDVFVRDMMTSSVNLVSETPEGALEPNRGARSPSISDDGRYVAFFTGRDFVPEDENGDQDLYVKDLVTGEYTWLDARGDGSALGDYVWDIRISGNGEHVLFDVYWTSLLPEDTNSRNDVYLWSWMTDELVLVSETPAEAVVTDRGAQSGGISDDGRYVAFHTGRDFVPEDENGNQDLYIWDRDTGDFHWQDVTGDGSSPGSAERISISGDGEYVVLTFDAALLPEDTNGRKDVYLWSIADEELTLVSETPESANETDRGANHASISDDGSVIAFLSGRDFVPEDTDYDLDIYVWEMATGEIRRVVITADGSPTGGDIDDLAISGDGQWLAFNWERSESEKRLGAAYYDPAATGEVSATAFDTMYEQVYVVSLGSVLEPGASRVSGLDRYGTSVAVSESAFARGADTIVIATGANWPDALCASALAGAVVGPVLLTTPDTLPADVVTEIMRLGAQHAYIVGGTTAVTEVVEDELNQILPGYVFRLSGDDRYGTSRAVANRVIDILGGTYSGKALVTTGSNYPDALAGAPLASGLDWPILLANVGSGAVYIPADTTDVMILGGPAAVPAGIETTLKTALGDSAVDRVGGLTRYDTAAQVAQAGVDAGLLWNGVGVASGEAYPDALAGGAAAGLQRTVVLLTTPMALDGYAEGALEDNKADIETVRFFGGVNALSTVVEDAVKAILGL
ncbi:MAG: cell wall-binding repeat-containing protein [Coriobacteriia bacterium]|nr:cell wall-binding repeat-containing protein [Coriobacteriia bacterium]